MRTKGSTRTLIVLLLLWSGWTGAVQPRAVEDFGLAQAARQVLIGSCNGGAASQQVTPADGVGNGHAPAGGRPNWGLVAVTFLVLYPLMVLLRLALGRLLKDDTRVSWGSWGPDGADPEAGDDGADPP